MQSGMHRSYWKAQYLDEVSDGFIGAFESVALDRPSPFTVVNCWHMGGAIAAVGAEDTAFPERAAPFLASIDGNWSDPAQDDDAVGWVRSAWDKFGQFGNGRAYLNFTGLAGEEETAGVEGAYGRNLRRLAGIKEAYDPANFLPPQQQRPAGRVGGRRPA
jgi:hypothetical protein